MLGRVPLRCLLVDDNASFLEVCRAVLEGPDLTVVGEATTAAEAVRRADELSPELVLLDIDLGEDSGLAVARELTDHTAPDARKVILISAHPEEDFADMVAESPALGFISKSDLSVAAVIALLRRHDAPPGGRAQRESR
jgi:DNA-binding NarL/FixJ family response regulator